MDTDFMKHKNFSKLMGEGSDIDESDDDGDDDLLDSTTENQNMNGSDITDQPIKLDTSLMSESMIKLVRSIEERIDNRKLGPQNKVQNCMLPSVHETEPPVTYYNDFDGDPSVFMDNEYKLINDIEQGLNYLYDRKDSRLDSEENKDKIFAANHNIIDQTQWNKNHNYDLDSLMNNNKPPRLGSKIVEHDSYNSSKLLKLKTKSKSSVSEIKKRLGEKVDEVPRKLFQCKECERQFHTYRQLQQHLNKYGHRWKTEKYTQVEEKRLSRKSREGSSPYDRPAKLRKFSSETRDLSPEKNVICQHCQEKFFSLENLLYHLRAEHKNRKNHIKDSAHRTKKYIHSKEKGDSSSQEKIEFSGSESDDDVSCETFSCNLCSKKFIKSLQLVHHINLTHRDASISDTHKFVCNLCEKRCLTKYDLFQHTEDKHLDGKNVNAAGLGGLPTPKKNVCKYCDATFFKLHNLQYHLDEAHKLK